MPIRAVLAATLIALVLAGLITALNEWAKPNTVVTVQLRR